MIRLDPELREVGIVLELATLDQNLLTIGFDAGNGVDLELEGFAIAGRVKIEIVLLALMLYDDCNSLSTTAREHRGKPVFGGAKLTWYSVCHGGKARMWREEQHERAGKCRR
jgi:hypothetical protein